MLQRIFTENQKLATVEETAAATTLSVATIRRKVKAGQFPRPVKLGAKSTRFVCAEVIAWLENNHQAPATAPNDTTQGGV